MKYTLFLIVILHSVLNIALAQDFHFSQFNETPSLINPALAGASNVFRASLVHRNQWRSITTPYSSYGINIEAKFKASNWEKQDSKRTMTFKKSYNRCAGGISIFNDKAGNANMGTLQGNLNFAMFFPLTRVSSLSLGLQGGLTQRKIDNSALIYPSQYSGTSYDPSMISGEQVAQQGFSYPELGAGILWSYGQNEKSISANNQQKALIGFSVYHINRAKQPFLTSDMTDRIYRKYIFHGNLLFGIPNSMFAVVPTWLIQIQGSSKEIVGGVMFKYYINDDSKYTGIIKRTSIGMGINYRVKDAIIPSVLIETGRYAVGISYDFNASELSKASNFRGGLEITLRFVTPNAFLYQRRTKPMFN